jgi:oligo-1,6-glucosidase
MTMNRKWWKETVVYQIYPRSFRDSNGDGIGDLRGIIEKLDHLKDLGVGVVWLSPVYKSPNDDGGYDISDYQDIMSDFGTLADWEEMIAGMHGRGIKLLMDLVVNHTSDEHPWFVEARKSKDNPYRDYYIWRPGRPAGRDGKGVREPNNWQSFFSGSAWQYDAQTGEYFLHLFSRKQPDLNWENPKVRAAVFKMMNWWLSKGVDGFRMDVINLISKVPGLPDAPVTDPSSPFQWGGLYFANGPRLLEFLAEMKREVLSKGDVFSVGETPMVTTAEAAAFTNEKTGSLNMVFQFEHMGLDTASGGFGKWSSKPWELRDLKEVISRWQNDLHENGWNSLYLSNHDQPRPVSRFGDDGPFRVESAKMLGTFLHMLQGTPYVYQGEEIGMTNVKFDTIEDYHDVETMNMYREVIKKGIDPQTILHMIYAKGRDNARTPLQWDDGPLAGFTSGKPWIKVNPNYSSINVQQSRTDPNSIFHYYRNLIQLRKDNPVIVYGKYHLLAGVGDPIYAFTRRLENDYLLVILNFSTGQPVFNLPAEITYARKELLIANYSVNLDEEIGQFTLRPYEARVYRLL